MRIVLLTDDSLIKNKKGMKWQDVLSFTDDDKVPGLSETLGMILRITLKRSIKPVSHSLQQQPQILHLDDIMGSGLSSLPGRVPKRAVHLANIDWTVPDHGNITHELLN